MTTGDALTVLVVDDDYRVADIHATLVNRVPGYEVVGKARTAAEARDLARLLRPDLVLMDIYLPDGNGLEVFRSLLEASDPPDVIVVSAAKEIATVREAMQLGAVHYLVKPFDFTALVDRLVAYRQLRRHLATLPEQASQSDVDDLFRMLRSSVTAPASVIPLPGKGHSAHTLELVRNAVRGNATDVSATEVAEMVGISRATAQRYLNYLDQHGVVRLRLKYGDAGRPEHRYQMRQM